MRLTFLGTGSSLGTPVIGCHCKVCLSDNSKDMRLRSSVFIETGKNNFVIDAGPDFRQQMLREKINKVNAVFLTHEHKDHTAGLDDVRALNYLMGNAMSVYGEHRVLESIKREYAYVFSDDKYPGIPELDLCEVKNKSFLVNSDEIIPIQVMHNLLPVFGYRIGSLAYITDAKTIPDKEFEKLHDLEVLVLSALREAPHISHMGLDEVLLTIERIKPKCTYLTHISHMQYAYNEFKAFLPENVYQAYDGLKVEV